MKKKVFAFSLALAMFFSAPSVVFCEEDSSSQTETESEVRDDTASEDGMNFEEPVFDEEEALLVEENLNSESEESKEPESAVDSISRVQALIDALPMGSTEPDVLVSLLEEIDEAMEQLSADELAQLNLSNYRILAENMIDDTAEIMPEEAQNYREATEFPFDDYLESLKVIITDTDGEHVVDYKSGDSTDIDLGEIQRNATLSATLAFNPNKAAGNEGGSSNPIIYGDTFTCTIPDILSNGSGGKWSGRLKDSTTNYGQKNGSIGDFTIENGKLTIKFDQGYIEETGGNIKDASLNFSGSFDAYGWEETSFEKSLYFGSLPIKVTFPAETVLRNLSIEKTPVNYGYPQFSSSYGEQGKSALYNTAKVDADGYVTYSIKVTAAEDNTTFLDNVTISDVFNTDNVDPSSIVLLSAIKGAKDTDIMDSVVTNYDAAGNITGWNVGRLNRGEEATVTFKIKIDKDKITYAVDAAQLATPGSSAEEARLIKNTATGTADKLANPVTDDAVTKVQNYVQVYKNRDGSYDPETGRQKFIIRITAPADNKYTEHNVYLKDKVTRYYDWVKDSGILSLTIKHADGTETTSTEAAPLYNNFAHTNNYEWTAYLNELQPGDVATITAYIDLDTDKYYEEVSSSTVGPDSGYNYMYAGKGDLSQSYDYISFNASKTWVYKSGSYQAADGTIEWTLTGNSYSSALPDANIAGKTVTDTIGANQTMNESEVLVTFYEPNSTTVRTYTGANAKDGKLAVPTTDTGYTFVVPEGYGDCRFKVTYKTKVTNNYGPASSYYNTGQVGTWTYTASTQRPRIASLEKQYLERGADWVKWGIKILGSVKEDDVLQDNITCNTDLMWMNDEDMSGLTITFNGKTVGRDLYTLEPTRITSGNNSGQFSGFTLTFNGSITDTDENGREITPSAQNPAVVNYSTHIAYPSYNSQTQYGNKASLIVDGETVDTITNYFYRSTYPEISKKYRNTVGSDITWTVTVNKNGYGCYKIDENNNPILYQNLGAGAKSGYYAIVTETIPKGLKFSTAKYGGNKGYYANTPTVETLSETKNEDGSTTVKLLIGNLMHYEGTPNSTSQYYNSYGYYSVDIDIVTQIVDKECLLDTTNKNFEWNNTASLMSMDGQTYEASATMNIAHVALSKEMKYDASTAPSAQFTIVMNEKEFDLDPDSDTIKVFDKSSSTLVVDTSSIKVVDTRDNSPVNFILDASQMAADGMFSLEVPDNLPLRITYDAGVSGVKDELVNVSNNAYFEGQKIEEVTSVINETVKVLNAAAQAQSDVMIWLRKMDATGNILPGCTFKLEKYTETDGWTTVKDDIVSEDDSKYATKVSGLNKNVLYRLTETEAAENYILDDTPHYFCLKVAEDSVVEMPDDLDGEVFYCGVAALINAYNAPYVPVTFRKNDENDAFLPGATFKVVVQDGTKDSEAIKDQNGNDVVFKIEDETALPKIYVKPGTYKLIETKAPAGYLPAADITFTANADETVSVGNKRVTDNTVICTDTPTSITIRKMDGSISPTVALSGATLQVLDGTTVKAEWTTDDRDHVITGVLNVNTTYTLHESAAPAGYLLAKDIEFTIGDDGKVTSTSKLEDGTSITNVADDGALVMVDTKPSLDIVKVNNTKHGDVAENAPLAGVSLTMSQGDTEIRTWETTVDADGKAVAEHFDNLEVGTTYSIQENSAPDGYELISDFTVTPNADGTFTVTGDDAVYEGGVLTIKNLYVPEPVIVNLKVEKKVNGDSFAKDTQFRFELKSKDTSEVVVVSVTGEGTANFEIEFTQSGTYEYTLREIDDKVSDFMYDRSVRNVKIVVEDNKAALSAKCSIDDEESIQTVFTNVYTKPRKPSGSSTTSYTPTSPSTSATPRTPKTSDSVLYYGIMTVTALFCAWLSHGFMRKRA